VILPCCTDADELGYQIASLVRVGERQAGVVAAPQRSTVIASAMTATLRP
jgi:hypothetical protein